MKKIFFGFILLFIMQIGKAQKTIIYCGQLIDVKTLQVQKEMSIIITGNSIIDVQKGYSKADATDKIIDLKSKTVMPGLMDMHVHVEEETSPTRYIDGFTKNKSDRAYVAIGLAQKDFMAGFTTLRDLGGSGVNISLRNAINKGLVIGPRIYTAGKSLATTGGHADPTNNYREDLMGDPGPDEGVVNGVADCAKAVRMRYKTGADLIKITATGGVLSMAKDGSGAQFTEEEIRTIVATAKDYGFKVAAHAHGAEGMKRAVLAGVSSIEHGTYMSEEVMELMKQHVTNLVPTIIAGKTSADSAKIPGYYPENVRLKAAVV